MRIKRKLEDSVELLLIKSVECFEVARAQQKIADLHSANARKIERIADALVEQAAVLQGEIEIESGRNSPPMREIVPAKNRRKAVDYSGMGIAG